MTHPCWPGNSPGCRRAWDPSHVCIRRDGRPIAGDEPCWFESSAQIAELAEQRWVTR